MFQIRRIYDDVLPVNKQAIAQITAILRVQFPLIREQEITNLSKKLRNPVKYLFRTILFVAEKHAGQVLGFAMIMHETELRFCYLDFISAAEHMTGRGIGGALYNRVRQEALALDCIGLFFECLPDDPRLSSDRLVRKQNSSRLRFYEQYGAYPIIGTAYETPVQPGDDNPPYLVYDALQKDEPLRAKPAQAIVRAILERKYGDYCPKEYIDKVVTSFRDDPVQLRPQRYVSQEKVLPVSAHVAADRKIALFLNEKHDIHHVRERGYVESPIRIKTILKEILPTDLFAEYPVRAFSDKYLRQVHDHGFVSYLKKVCAQIGSEHSVYPYVFPIRNISRPPKILPIRAGYYCIDTFTPLNSNAFLAARRAIDCGLSAAKVLLDEGRRICYALVRPPGHHSERKTFGGFCYFNTNAVAAQFLSQHGRVAILDIDYHHGNGQQDIFYQRDDVFTVSIHGHPSFAYPYFSGFENERGSGPGKGFNVNYALDENIEGEQYSQALLLALRRIKRFAPDFLVVALGLDTAKGDPTGSWFLTAKDFKRNGRMIGELGLPTLVIQEGGYNHRNLGVNARAFFTGLWAAAHA